MAAPVSWLTARGGAIWFIRLGLRRLRRDWALVAMALVLSLSLWIFVANEENPPRTGVFTQPIAVEPVNVPAGLDTVGEIDPIQVRIVAPADLWPRLAPSYFRATVDLSAAAEGGYEAPVKVTSADSRVRLLEVIPTKALVRLEPLEEAEVPVKVNLQGQVAAGYAANMPMVNPPTVEVRGPRSLAALVKAAIADVKLDGLRADIEQSFQLTPRDLQGHEVKGVSLAPRQAAVKVSIEQQVQFRSLAVVPNLKGTVAPGYQVTRISVEPLAIAVAGSPAVLQEVAYLQTQPVDIADAASEVQARVGLELPAGISIMGSPRVTVTVGLERMR